MLRQKPCRSHRKPRRNPPNRASPHGAFFGPKIDDRISLFGYGISGMKKWCAIVICAIVLSLPSGKAKSIDPVTTATVTAAALTALSRVLSWFDSGADPMALSIQQTYHMVAELHNRLNNYDVVLESILRNIDNMPEIMSDIVRSEIGDETARRRQERVMALVTLIGEDLEVKLGGEKPVAGLSARLHDLQIARSELMQRESVGNIPYISTAMAVELRLIQNLDFSKSAEGRARSDFYARKRAYTDYLERVADGVLRREYNSIISLLGSRYNNMLQVINILDQLNAKRAALMAVIQNELQRRDAWMLEDEKPRRYHVGPRPYYDISGESEEYCRVYAQAEQLILRSRSTEIFGYIERGRILTDIIHLVDKTVERDSSISQQELRGHHDNFSRGFRRIEEIRFQQQLDRRRLPYACIAPQ